MKPLTFLYTKTGIWYRPLIPITLKLGKKEIKYIALIDSGADFNIFHEDIAKILKIDLSKLKSMKFSGIKEGAEGIGRFTSLDLGIDNTFFNSPVVFSNDISPNGYGILGQQGFFNHFKIQFDYPARTIRLEKEGK